MKKLVWTEGTLLSQQHLQQWDAMLQARQLAWQQCVAPLQWGVIELEIVTEALKNNVFQVRRCHCLFPGGYRVDLKDAALSFNLTSQDPVLTLYLCLPENDAVAALSGYPMPKVRPAYTVKYTQVADCYDASRCCEVAWAEENLFLQSVVADQAGVKVLPIARVQQDSQGWRLSQDFIPPLCQVRASTMLRQHIENSVALLKAQLAKQPVSLSSEHGLQAGLMRATLQFREVLNADFVSPQKVFTIYLDLLSHLAVQAPALTLEQLPTYDHQRLFKTFDQCQRLLRTRLAMKPDRGPQVIPLHARTLGYFETEAVTEKQVSQAHLILKVSHPHQQHWAQDFLHQCKIASCEQLPTLINAALPGLVLQWLPHPPAPFPSEPNTHYFSLTTQGELWDDIVATRSLAVFIAPALSDVTLTLYSQPQESHHA